MPFTFKQPTGVKDYQIDLNTQNRPAPRSHIFLYAAMIDKVKETQLDGTYNSKHLASESMAMKHDRVWKYV